MSRNAILGLLGALALTSYMWFYAEHIQIPMQKAVEVAHQRPRGNLSDLYPRWLGARELLLHHRDPYSADVTLEIQSGYYGRPLDPTRPGDPQDKQAFAYPVYVVFLLAPIIGLPFALVQAVFRWFLILVMAGAIMLWFRALQWRVSVPTLAAAIIVIGGSFPAMQGIALRQLSVLVAGFLSMVFFLVVTRRFVLAGLLLSVATIKPQLTFPLCLWFALWAFSSWPNRKRLVFGFIGGITILLISAELVLPGWIREFYYATLAYQKYTSATPATSVLFAPVWGIRLNFVLIFLVAILCWRLRRGDETSTDFAFGTCFVLAATVGILPIFAPYNQLLLVPGILFLIQHRGVLIPKSLWQKFVLGLAILMICWQWIACGFLLVIYFFSADLVQRLWAMPFYATIALPFIIMYLLYASMRLTRSALVIVNARHL